MEWFTSLIDLRLYYAYFAFPVSTPAQALALAELLEGRGLAKKASALELLTGLGAKLTRASDLPSPSAPRDPIPTMVPALDRLLCGGLPRGGFVELSGRRSCGRFSIGIVVVAGMSIGTLFTLFVLPAVYTWIATDHRAAAQNQRAKDIEKYELSLT